MTKIKDARHLTKGLIRHQTNGTTRKRMMGRKARGRRRRNCQSPSLKPNMHDSITTVSSSPAFAYSTLPPQPFFIKRFSKTNIFSAKPLWFQNNLLFFFLTSNTALLLENSSKWIQTALYDIYIFLNPYIYHRNLITNIP